MFLKKVEVLIMAKDFTEGHPFKVIFLFSLPMLIGNIFQQLYSTVDSIIVGNFVGKNALAAISGSGSVQFLLVANHLALLPVFRLFCHRYMAQKNMTN